MKLIREICNKHCVIRTSTYAHTYAHIALLAQVAQEDFPGLDVVTIQVAHYAGERYKRTYGVEFLCPDIARARSQAYTEISTMEDLL